MKRRRRKREKKKRRKKKKRKKQNKKKKRKRRNKGEEQYEEATETKKTKLMHKIYHPQNNPLSSPPKINLVSTCPPGQKKPQKGSPPSNWSLGSSSRADQR